MSSLAAALATARIAQKHTTGGKIVLFGTPAEEGGGGKIKLLNAGAYTDHNVDISLISHPCASPDAALVRTAAYSSFKVEFFGKEAHAAVSLRRFHTSSDKTERATILIINFDRPGLGKESMPSTR